MKPTKKDLKRLIEKLDYLKDDYPRDGFANGYNVGVDASIQVIQELIDKLEQ